MLVLATVLALAAAAANAKAADNADDANAVDMRWGVKLAMRDGVKLNATVYLHATTTTSTSTPATATAATTATATFPLIVSITPYVSDNYEERAVWFARRGFAYALVDARGRGNSAGAFDPFFQEPRDGYDVVEALAKQPWCNGKVAMWGGSYAGFDQWMTAREKPPHLVTIVPASAAYAGVDFPMENNILGSYVMQWLTLVAGTTDNGHAYGDDAFWRGILKSRFLAHASFESLGDVNPSMLSTWKQWTAHPTRDAFWQRLSIKPAQYRALAATPILTILGAYDADQGGGLTYYREQLAAVGNNDNHWLIIGPWNHAGTRTPKKDVGGVSFGDASVIDMNALHRDWYSWAFGMTTSPPSFLQKRVAFYVTGPGADVWKYADTLALVSTSSMKLYAHGPAWGVFDAGVFDEKAPTLSSSSDRADVYTYDPLDTSNIDLDLEDWPASYTDQRLELAFDRGAALSGVVYQSAPLKNDVVVAGQPRVEAWLATDASDSSADVDVTAGVFDVRHDGSAVLLGHVVARARYRDGADKPSPIVPGKPFKMTFDARWIARRIPKGDRIRLSLSSPNTMYLAKNYGSGGVVEKETGKDARTSHVHVVHDVEHATHLVLPLGSL